MTQRKGCNETWTRLVLKSDRVSNLVGYSLVNQIDYVRLRLWKVFASAIVCLLVIMLPPIALSLHTVRRNTRSPDAIRNNKEIKGIKIYNTEVKVSQYADGTTLILDGTEESIRASLLLIEAFGNISGPRLNNEKTEALWIGSKRNSNLKKNFSRKTF